jgi:paraquat-inducible protein B
VDPLAKEVGKTLKTANSALKRAESAVKDIQDQTSDKSVLIIELKTTMRELSAAARSIRGWADYLERHPEALIRGKGGYRR